MSIILKGYWVERTQTGALRQSVPWHFALGADVVARHIVDNCGFVHYYDGAAVACDNHITPLDWGVTSLLMGPIRTDATFSLLAAQPGGRSGCPASIGTALSRVPTAAKLAEDGADKLYARPIEDLLRATCGVKGVGPSIATKLLHKKRPDLIPVVDSLVFEFYTGMRMPGEKQASIGPVVDLITGAFRNDLRANVGHGRFLGECRAHLRRESIDFLTDVRLLELTIWLACRRPSSLGLSKPSWRSDVDEPGRRS